MPEIARCSAPPGFLFFSGEPGKKPEDYKDLKDTKERHEEKPEFLRLVPEDLHRGECTERPEESAAQQGGFGDPPPCCHSPPFVSCIEKEDSPIHSEKEQYGEFSTPASIPDDHSHSQDRLFFMVLFRFKYANVSQ